jgi:hypothetical protein
MSTGQVPPIAQAAAAAPAPKKNAIQILEEEMVAYIRQREQVIANVHALDGAIQATQGLLSKLRAAAAKAAETVEEDTTKAVDAVKTEAENVVEFVKKEL